MQPRPYLDICTCYVTPAALDLLIMLDCRQRLARGWPAMTVAEYDYGVFLTVPNELTESQAAAMPASLVELLETARRHGAELVRLDSSGDAWPDLPEYDLEPDAPPQGACAMEHRTGPATGTGEPCRWLWQLLTPDHLVAERFVQAIDVRDALACGVRCDRQAQRLGVTLNAVEDVPATQTSPFALRGPGWTVRVSRLAESP